MCWRAASTNGLPRLGCYSFCLANTARDRQPRAFPSHWLGQQSDEGATVTASAPFLKRDFQVKKTDCLRGIWLRKCSSQTTLTDITPSSSFFFSLSSSLKVVLDLCTIPPPNYSTPCISRCTCSCLLILLQFASFSLLPVSRSLLQPALLLYSPLGQDSSLEYSQCSAEKLGPLRRAPFPLHFTQGLAMRQTQLQTDDAARRASPCVCVSGTDDKGRLLKAAVLHCEARLNKMLLVHTC